MSAMPTPKDAHTEFGSVDRGNSGMTSKATGMLLNAPKAFPELKNPKWKKFVAELQTSHVPLVEKELSEANKKDTERCMQVLLRMTREQKTDLGTDAIDWDKELAEFKDLPYPSYYMLPFHSNLGGWLSHNAASNDKCAMNAIYHDVHPMKCDGLRQELAKLLPEDARLVVDFGSGTGDGPAEVARLLPNARVVACEASPFMIIVGRRQNRDVPNMEYRHCLAEATGLDAGTVDVVTITLLFHECSDEGKANIIKEAHRLLKPGGTLLFSDTPVQDLHTYRGFLEPWKDQWLHFKVDEYLPAAGFTDLKAYNLTAPPPDGFQVRPTEQSLFTRVAKKPIAQPSKL